MNVQKKALERIESVKNADQKPRGQESEINIKIYVAIKEFCKEYDNFTSKKFRP